MDLWVGARAPVRNDHSLVLPFAAASRVIALAAAYSDECNAPALHATNRDAVANSTRLSRDSRLRLFHELHHKWFGPAFPWIPLSPFSVTAVGAMLKAGR